MTEEQKKKFENLVKQFGPRWTGEFGPKSVIEVAKAAYNLALEDARIVADRERKSVMGQYPEAEAHRIACANIYENIDDLKIQ